MEEERIARLAHEVNRAYCMALGDNSQPAWEDAPDWQRQSAIKGVRFHQDNPDSTPESSHLSWLEDPCFVPYDQLPVEQRAKDYLFAAVVRTCLSM